MQDWIVLLPPILVLIIAITTHNVVRSLLVGIITASFIAAKFNPILALKVAFDSIVDQSGLYNLFTWQGDFDKIYIYGFLLALGIIITLITETGGTVAYSRMVSGKLSGKKAAQTLSLSLSSGFFLDDYFNSLTVGSIIRPIFDHFKIARVKLAYLIDAMSSAVCALVPLSSWTAMIVAQLQESGITEEASAQALFHGDPFVIYLKAIPYTLYPLCVIIAAWFVVRKQISYGPMAEHEKIAAETGNLYGGKEPSHIRIQEPEHGEGTIGDFLFPMGMLVILILTALLYTGKFVLFGGTNNLLNAIRSSESFPAFFYASIITLFICTLYFLLRGKITMKKIGAIYMSGFHLMKGSLLLLLFASTLGILLKDNLQTGQYLAQLLVGTVPNFMLPFIFFLASSIVTASTGSSWGTILVMFPIALPMISAAGAYGLIEASQVPLLLPSIGAILSGSVAGAHMSPISDATVISSTAAGAIHIDHVKTQFYYVFPVVIGAGISFIIAGFFAGRGNVLSLLTPIGITLVISLGSLWLCNYVLGKK